LKQQVSKLSALKLCVFCVQKSRYGRPTFSSAFSSRYAKTRTSNFRKVVPQNTEGMVGSIYGFCWKFTWLCSSKEFWKSVRNWQSYRHEFGVGLLHSPLPRPHPQWGGGHPLPTLHPLGANGLRRLDGCAFGARYSAPRLRLKDDLCFRLLLGRAFYHQTYWFFRSIWASDDQYHPARLNFTSQILWMLWNLSHYHQKL